MKLVRSEKGTVVVLVAFTLSILLGVTALVVDGGMLFWEKSRLQKAMDAAVLAGAQELPGRPDQARAQAERVAAEYGITPAQLNLSFNDTYTEFRASTVRRNPAWISSFMGFSQLDVGASAKVGLQSLTSGKGAIPLGVQASTALAFGTRVTLKVGDSSAGNFGALALTGPGAKDYETDLRDGFQMELSVGDALNTQTGNITNPTKRAIEHRIAACPLAGAATYQDYPDHCPLIVLVPVFQPVVTDQNQVKQVKVIGFSSFFIERVGQTNEGSEIVGRFIEFAQSGSSSSGQAGYGTYGYKLLE